MLNIADIKSLSVFETNNNLQILNRSETIIFWLYLQIQCQKQIKSAESDDIDLKQSVTNLLRKNDISDGKENEWNEPFRIDENSDIYHVNNLKSILFLKDNDKQRLSDTINEIFKRSEQHMVGILIY